MSDYLKPEQPEEKQIHHPIIKEAKYAEGESGTEEDRQELVKFYGLSSEANWQQIWEAIWETDRKDLVQRFGLDENASWDDIHSIITDNRILDGTFDKILHIPPNATPEERFRLSKMIRLNKEIGE